jgi:hypothetical protein
MKYVKLHNKAEYIQQTEFNCKQLQPLSPGNRQRYFSLKRQFQIIQYYLLLSHYT